MAGLLDDDGSLESAGFLRGLLGASQQRKRPFTMLLGGLAGLQQAQAAAAQQAQAQAMAERKLAIEEALKNAQINELMSQAAQREAEPQRKAEMLQALRDFAGGGAPSQYGLAGGGVSMGGVREQMTPQSGLARRTPEEAMMLKAATGVDPLEFMKAAQVGYEQKPGSFYVKPGGGREFTPDVKEGLGFGPGGVFNLPGAVESRAAMKGAETEAQKRAETGYQPGPVDVTSGRTTQTMRQFIDGLQAPQQGGMPDGLAPVNGRVPQNKEQASKDLTDFVIAQRTNIGGAPKRGVQTMLTPGEQVQAAADKEWATKRAGSNATQYEKILESGFTAPTNIARYEQIGKLLADHDGGKLSPLGLDIASTANSLGLKMKDLPNKEAAEALANELALTKRNPSSGAGMPGALSDADREYLKKMTPNMSQSKEGRQVLISANIALARRDQEVAQAARNYVEKNGKLDDDFFSQLSRWANANPLFGR